MALDFLSGAGYIVVIATVFICLIGVLVWWLWNKNRYRFTFRLYSSDMKNSRLIKGKITVDESNKKYKYFTFKDNNTRLEILQPNHFEDGKPVRLITYDETGEYIYIKGESVDNESYLKYSLKPEHKTLYLQMLKDNANKHPLFDKGMLLAFAGLIIIGIFLTVGFIYTFASNVKQGDQLVELSKENNKLGSVISSTAKSIEVSTNNIYMATSLLYNGTINRPLGADGGSS